MMLEVPPAALRPVPPLTQIFTSFVTVAVFGFGGTMPWSRRMLVDVRQWMTAEEYNEAFAFCQFLPGPNIINLAIVFGARMRGVLGAAAAFFGLVAPPTILMIVIGMIYARYGDAQALQRILGGVGAAVAGLILGMFAMMVRPAIRKQPVQALSIIVAVLIAIAVFRISMLWTLLVLCPISIWLAWRAAGERPTS
jgi:chromate transporter